ncbi:MULTISPECIES: putative quinol monooxygenase [Halocynthiibacter]|uniref:Antibiotic biosynthesis monooxygenase n=1 Tax=Halocynthiibacter halioticoli TaxID=2986804 RepID=A0AAE3IZT6_9RHOB|nr:MULTISPECIES: putative quinol monooxygenase [Halocynthiibacter]MCV6825367.1 antibiotic biosynthesis monooxygenase [Halocynthiibacter halioticoli]MCW4058368.1 antibiotic biosynthesis monooxygenase [Halocynthiibacter sp. SDUM655004]
MFAVCVTFIIEPSKAEAFHAHINLNAKASVEMEAGCQLFDVCTDPSDPAKFFLYEIYDSAAAFDEHLESAHFKSFCSDIEGMVIDKKVESFENVTAARK